MIVASPLSPQPRPIPGDAIDPVLIGHTIGGFRLLRELGGGLSCRVFEARHVGSGRAVALKLLQPSQAADERIYSRFIREVRAVSQIDNPHVVRVVQVGQATEGPYFAMELVVGVSLKSALQLESALRVSRAVGIALQVCDALAAAHDVGVIHRDLKPSNVLLCRQPAGGGDFVRLIDFGVAKLNPFVDNISVESTVPGTIVGSPAYMAPEQIRGRPVDARTDIYALGVVLYEMLSGRVPFDGEVLPEILVGHVCRPPTAFGELEGQAATIDPGLGEVVLRCLAKRPEDRPAGMLQLAEELRPFAP